MNRIAQLITLSLASFAFAGPTQKSFTPTSYKYPITRISLSKADFTGEQVLYSCTPGDGGTDCLTDAASPAALAAIEAAATNVPIEPGDYTWLVLQSCPPGTTGLDTIDVLVEGSVTVDGQAFSTSTAATSGMAAGTTVEPTAIRLGCGGARVKLESPLQVTAGSSQTLTMLVDLTNVTWTDARASAGMGGCKADTTDAQDICTTFPFIVPYVGSAAATFERYLVAHSSTATALTEDDANGAVSFAVDPSGAVFYAATTPYYSETSPSWNDATKGGPDYNTSTRTLSTNGDGSIAFQTGGDANDNRVGFTAFQRMNHAGTCKNELPTSPVWQYSAFKQ